MNKNDIITLKIEDMGIDGEGIGKIDGMTFFVKDAVIGDEIEVTAKAYAKSVEILNENEDLILSDNYFDMNAGTKRVKIESGDVSRLTLRSVYDIR